MKLLIITIIVLVIPTFFAFVFVMGTVNKLTSLRKRCEETRRHVVPGAAVVSPSTPNSGDAVVREADARREFALAAEQYNAARTRFPASLLAALWGFHEPDPLPQPSASEGRPDRDQSA